MCLGIQQIERDRLKIKAFYLRLSVSGTRKPFPDSLTLCYLPRINGSPLEVSGSSILPDSPGFVTLHRSVVSGEKSGGFEFFGSRERVRLSQGVRFEVYVREDKVLKGIFRKDEGNQWKMDVKCVLEREIAGAEVKEAEVCVAVDGEGEAAMREKVAVMVRRRRKGRSCFQKLEEIPEEREGDVTESDGCGCYCCGCRGEEEAENMGSDGGDCTEEMEMEGVRWAVDVGIWVVCLGVGYLVSKASSKSLRGRRRIL